MSMTNKKAAEVAVMTDDAPPAEAPAERLLHTGWGADEWKSLPLTRRLEVHAGDCAKAADESGDAVMLANQLCALHDDIREALTPTPPAAEVLARAFYHPDDDGDYEIFIDNDPNCAGCIPVLIVRDTAALRPFTEEDEK